jgi:N-acetylneuraminic acid mutarotase
MKPEKLMCISEIALLVALTFPASLAVAQNATVMHNKWSSGAPMPTAVVGATAGVLEGRIYVVGGLLGNSIVSGTQVYNPATDSWGTGVPLPNPLRDSVAAVVNNVLYVIGGDTNRTGSAVTNEVWAYSPKTKRWSSKNSMPTARTLASAVVASNIIYVIGGWNGAFSGPGLATVESYNPATDMWTEEAPLPVGKWAPSSGAFGTKNTGYTIVAPDGAAQCCPSDFTGDNESYDVSANAWASLNADPSPRAFACFGTIGSKMYVSGGSDTQGPSLSVTESYQLSKNAWKTLAPIPQPTTLLGSAVYNGKLYCFGGWDAWNGNDLNNVQIYQP